MKTIKSNEFLKEKRIDAGLTQLALAKLVGTSERLVQYWESGSRTPKLNNVIRLSKYLNFDINDYLKAIKKEGVN